MNKLRSDSHWSRLDQWLFDDGLTCVEVLKRAKEELSVTASLSSLKRYRQRAARWQGVGNGYMRTARCLPYSGISRQIRLFPPSGSAVVKSTMADKEGRRFQMLSPAH